jgi:hypothetical protein
MEQIARIMEQEYQIGIVVLYERISGLLDITDRVIGKVRCNQNKHFFFNLTKHFQSTNHLTS